MKDVSRSFRPSDVQATLIGLTFLAGLSDKTNFRFCVRLLIPLGPPGITIFTENKFLLLLPLHPDRAKPSSFFSESTRAVSLAIFGKYFRGSACGSCFFYAYRRSADRLLAFERNSPSENRSNSTTASIGFATAAGKHRDVAHGCRAPELPRALKPPSRS